MTSEKLQFLLTQVVMYLKQLRKLIISMLFLSKLSIKMLNIQIN
jgi:hypothetical protein